MESYQFVKREGNSTTTYRTIILTPFAENIRRVFHKWLTLSRTARQRRITLQQKEDEIKFSIISSAWDKWRDHFCDGRLRPIVRLIKTPWSCHD
jgi:protein SFI1